MINDELEPQMVLEWIKGEKMGEQETVSKIVEDGDFTWVYFVNTGRINKAIINEWMVEIGKIDKPLGIYENDNSSVGILQEQKSVTVQPLQQKESKTNAFGFDILDKAKRDSVLNLKLEIEFDFISEDKVQMLIGLYGDEIVESLKLYIRKQLTEETINFCIEQYINSTYNK
jgi:hypothetical protein